MIKIVFVCFGNICRSPMAEFVMKDLIRAAGLDDKIIADSAGCHPSIGTPMSDGTRQQLRKHNIAFTRKTSAQLTRADYSTYDYIIGLDKSNVEDIIDIMNGDPEQKVHLLLAFADENRSVADPWYTDDYATTYVDVLKGCTALLEVIKREVQ